MPEHECVRAHLHLFEQEPDHALAIGDGKSVSRLAELVEKAFEALGQCHIGLCVDQFRLERGQLGRGRRLALSQWGHARAQFLQREQLFLVGLDEPGHRSADPGQPLDDALALRGHRMLGAQRRQSAIDLLADQRGIRQQSDDFVPDQGVQRILSHGAVRAAAPL